MVVAVENYSTDFPPPDYYCIVLVVGFYSYSVCSCSSDLRVEDDAICNVHRPPFCVRGGGGASYPPDWLL